MRRIDWFMLPGQRPWRELHWLSRMPATTVRALGSPAPPDADDHVELPYLQPTRRFVEAGALAWLRGLDGVRPVGDWVASLELCSLVSGQASRFATRHGLRQAVLVWANDPTTPLYRFPPYSWATRASLRADLFLCFVEAAASHLEELGVERERIRVVHPGVDLGVFHPPDSQPVEPLVAFVSPVAENKGIDRVLEAFALVRREVPDARLVVAGRGPLVSLVREAAARPGSGVTHLGHLDRGGVADLLRRATVFTTAPRANRFWNEQFGLAYVEAMACGVPVVTTACGSNHEAVAGPNVLVPDDVEALAAGILGFLDDPAARRRVSAWNVDHVRDHRDIATQTVRMGQVFSDFEG